MTACQWEEVGPFQLPADFKRIESWLTEEVAEGRAELIAAATLVDGAYFGEWRYRHSASGDVWVLAIPDYPFRGLFYRDIFGKQVRER